VSRSVVFRLRPDANGDHAPKVSGDEHIKSGFSASQQTIELMRATFSKLKPRNILQTYIAAGKKKAEIPDKMWSAFGTDTIAVMQNGVHLLALLWESAWILGEGEERQRNTKNIGKQRAMDICAPADFLASCAIDEIGRLLSKPQREGPVMPLIWPKMI
jgi:hypothetical protein